MSSPFRELFVEVPQAILEAIANEALAKQAESMLRPRPRHPISEPIARLISQRYVHLVMNRYGWTTADVMRMEFDRIMRLVVTQRCGHRTSYEIDERMVLACCAPMDEVDMLDRVFDTQPRGCYCVSVPR